MATKRTTIEVTARRRAAMPETPALLARLWQAAQAGAIEPDEAKAIAADLLLQGRRAVEARLIALRDRGIDLYSEAFDPRPADMARLIVQELVKRFGPKNP